MCTVLIAKISSRKTQKKSLIRKNKLSQKFLATRYFNSSKLMLKAMLFLFLLLFIQLFQEVFSELKRHITSMYKVQNLGLIFWLGLRIMLSFAEENDQADVFKHCMNSTNSTSCSFTYEHVYNSLTKNESNFNISYALYPDGAKPSFLVRVNVYGPNRTTNSIPAKFTWSIHCLYANVPTWPLQILSLFAITVSSRTQDLNIKVPAFCCNMSDDKKKREEMIQGFLTRILFEVSVNNLLIFCTN